MVAGLATATRHKEHRRLIGEKAVPRVLQKGGSEKGLPLRRWSAALATTTLATTALAAAFAAAALATTLATVKTFAAAALAAAFHVKFFFVHCCKRDVDEKCQVCWCAGAMRALLLLQNAHRTAASGG